MHAGHHFEIYVQVSEDGAQNNTRQLGMTAQEGVWPGRVNVGRAQPHSHVSGKACSLFCHCPSLRVTKMQWPQLADSILGC